MALNQSQIDSLRSLTSEIEQQAEATAKFEMEAKGMSDTEIKIAFLKAQQLKSYSKINAFQIEQLELLQQFEKKQERKTEKRR